jgi:hypothetical protein
VVPDSDAPWSVASYDPLDHSDTFARLADLAVVGGDPRRIITAAIEALE